MNKLVLTLASIVLIIAGFYFGRYLYVSNESRNTSIDIEMSGVDIQSKDKNRKMLFMGVREPRKSELLKVYPSLSEKPMMVAFTSKYCLDCKHMKPVVEEIVNERDDFTYESYDIMADAKTYPHVFNVFKPVSVPTLIFIDKTGYIQNVLYNKQSKETIDVALNTLTGNKAMASTEEQTKAAS